MVVTIKPRFIRQSGGFSFFNRQQPKVFYPVKVFSGTANETLARAICKSIGIEREPKYFDIACRRIEDAQRQGRLIA